MSNIAPTEPVNQELNDLIDAKFREFREGTIVKGTILEIRPQVVLVDIGYKSEGAIPSTSSRTTKSRSATKSRCCSSGSRTTRAWSCSPRKRPPTSRTGTRSSRSIQEGGLVRGKVKAVVKGGLMVNVGVEAFLPGSQIDIIPPKDLNEYVGNVYEFKIVKVNDERKNIVLSRREVIEAERAELRQRFLETVKVGDKVAGAVKNITDFGAFVDLQGMDGLLHITDMSWGRINHPSEMLAHRPEWSRCRSSTSTARRNAFRSASSRCSDNPWEDIEAQVPDRPPRQGQDHQARCPTARSSNSNAASKA